MPTDLDNARYISLTTFKKDGTPVASPVWIVPYKGGYAFNTEADSFKVKRLKKNSAVTLAPSSVKGTVKAGATTHSGTATISGEDNPNVNVLVRAKYRLSYPILIGSGELWRKLRRKPEPASVAILISLTD